MTRSNQALATIFLLSFLLLVPGAARACEPPSRLCLESRSGRQVLVQATDLGPLVLELDLGSGDLAPSTHPDGTSFLHLHRAPAAASLGDQPAVPVVLDAALTFGPDGEVVPPSTLLVSSRELRATFVLVADSKGRPVPLDSVERESPETESGAGARRLAGIPPEEWPLVQHLVGLDEPSWSAVRWLASLPPAEGSAPRPAGVVLAPGAGGDGSVVLPQGIFDVLNDLLSRVNGVRTVVNNVQGVLGTARPDIRGLVSGINLGQLQQLMDQVREVLQGALAIAQELRAGFETFNVTAFRTDLTGLLGDLGTSWVNAQKLGCFDRPDLAIREWNFPLATRLIAVAPPIVLYAMSRMLEEVAPDWRTSIHDLNASIPPSLLEGVCTEAAAAAGSRTVAPSALCERLMPSPMEPSLKGVKMVSKLVSTRFEVLSEWAKDSDVVGLGAVVVGGATIVKKVEYPSKPAYKQLSIMLDRLSGFAENLLDKRKDCLDDLKDEQAMEREIESMLRECHPTHTLFLAPTDATVPPTLADVATVSQVFINRMRAAGYITEADAAQEKWNRHLDETTVRGRFEKLCASYAVLLPGAPPPTMLRRMEPRAQTR